MDEQATSTIAAPQDQSHALGDEQPNQHDEAALGQENARLRGVVAQQQEQIQLLRSLLERTQHALSSLLPPLASASTNHFEQLKADIATLENVAAQRKHLVLGDDDSGDHIPSTLSLPFHSSSASSASSLIPDATASEQSVSAVAGSSSASADQPLRPDSDDDDDDDDDDGGNDDEDSGDIERDHLLVANRPEAEPAEQEPEPTFPANNHTFASAYV
jgi:hypothetical protein